MAGRHPRYHPISTALIAIFLITLLPAPAAEAHTAAAPPRVTWALPDVPQAPDPLAAADLPDPLTQVLPQLQTPAP